MKLPAVILFALSLSLHAQGAAPEELDELPYRDRPNLALLADSPVKFPERGALPSKFPADLRVARSVPEDGYSISGSPCRSLTQIDAIQKAMPAGEFALPPTGWLNLPRTRKALNEGGELHILGLGDSIVNDTFRSAWLAKLAEAYPKAKISGTVYVRGGGSCKHYRHEGRIEKHLVPLRPDLVFIGGISQGKDYEAIRDVVTQIRAQLPETEFILATGAFGSIDPRRPDLLAKAQHSGTSDYGEGLAKLAAELKCAYIDMTTPWADYIRSTKLHPHHFYRDVVHANATGEQILSKILLSFFDTSR